MPRKHSLFFALACTIAALVVLYVGVANAETHMLFIADQNTATIDEQSVTFFELNVGATKYRIGKAAVDPEVAETYNYYRMQGHSLASEGATHLLDVLMPDQYVSTASQADEFRGWSYTDLAARIANGQFSNVILKKMLRIRYTVTPTGGEDDTGRRDGTIEAYEADASAGKAWGRAYLPFKWFGRDFE